MIRVAVVSSSDEFLRTVRRAASTGEVRIDLMLRSAAELRSASEIDVLIVHAPAAVDLELLIETVGSMPIVVAGVIRDEAGISDVLVDMLTEQDGCAVIGSSDSEQVLAAAVAAARGLIVTGPAASLDIERLSLTRTVGAMGNEKLTAREIEVLRLIAAGGSNRDVASKLGIPENTVKYHLTSLYSKLGITRRAEAVFAAIKRGMITI